MIERLMKVSPCQNSLASEVERIHLGVGTPIHDVPTLVHLGISSSHEVSSFFGVFLLQHPVEVPIS